MDTVKITFTKTPWSPISLLIRWALPRSRFTMAESSHCYITVGNYVYEADFNEKVHKVELASSSDITDGLTVVKELTYSVPNMDKLNEFLEAQLGKDYDIGGALGVGINPDRDWSEADKWFCYELCAAALVAGECVQFNNVNHITETALMSVGNK